MKNITRRTRGGGKTKKSRSANTYPRSGCGVCRTVPPELFTQNWRIFICRANNDIAHGWYPQTPACVLPPRPSAAHFSCGSSSADIIRWIQYTANAAVCQEGKRRNPRGGNGKESMEANITLTRPASAGIIEDAAGRLRWKKKGGGYQK